jgi:threonine dehydratase
VLFVPTTAPPGKLDAARAYGSEVRLVGTTFVERRDAAETFAAEHDLALVSPFDDARIIAGQGTCGLEITEDLEDIDVVIAPIGGGGLVAGLCLAITEARPSVSIVGVEVQGADTMGQALITGNPVAISPPETVADALTAFQVGALPFSIARERIAGPVGVDDDAILDAVRFLLARARLVVEPSGAVGVAALLSGRLALEGRSAVIILSGGNADPSILIRALTG